MNRIIFILHLLLLMCNCNRFKREPPVEVNNLKVVKTYVENFQPDTMGTGTAIEFPKEVVSAFQHLKNNRVQQERYLTLLYLKVYRGHIKCCGGALELRKSIPAEMSIDSASDPLLYEYNLITEQFHLDKSVKFIPSGIALGYLENQDCLLSYPKIKAERDKIYGLLKD